MKLDDTSIPADRQADFFAALSEMRAFQGKAVLGKCMFWSPPCEKPPIASHLVPESWLRKIADDENHVVRFEMATRNLPSDGAKITPRRVGVAQKPAVTFPGFCAGHDTELFACLEQKQFVASAEQLLALTYRSTCQEAWIKYQMVSCHLPRASQAPPFVARHVVSEMNNCSRLMTWKGSLESTRNARSKDIAGYIVRFATRPTMLASATVSFPMTLTGRSLEARYEYLTVSIVPSDDGGFGLFTWSKHSPKNPSLLVKSLHSIPRELWSDAFINLILEVSESFYLSPRWWDSLAAHHQESLLRRFGRSLNGKNPKPPLGWLLPKAPPMANWNVIEGRYL
jgi:hypothetical protein